MDGLIKTPLRFGLVVGLVFGAVNLAMSWLKPLDDDTVPAVLGFYGPMFFVWAYASYRSTLATGRLVSGVMTGTLVAFATFCVYSALVLVRVNLFLDELTGRADWRSMVQRFEASGFESLRLFTNLDYLKGTPLKLGAASMIGALMGTLGGLVGWLRNRRPAGIA